MKAEDKEIFEALKYDEIKNKWFYSVPTFIRRNGRVIISEKKYNELKKQYDKIKKL